MNYSKYKHRMCNMKVKLTMPDGSPLRNAEVIVEQKKHEFLFGCADFANITRNNRLSRCYEEKVEERRQKIFELFNYFTLPFYWNSIERVKGQTDIETLKETAQWLKSKGFVLKGHPLCWHSCTPQWLLDMSNTQILTSQTNRIKHEVKEFTGLINTWDVINETVIMPVFKKKDNGITRACKDIGRIRMVSEMFKAAKEANPDSYLIINDFVYTSIDAYEILVEGCLEAGIPIDAIGIQSHMHQGYWGVERTLEILERFSQFNLPIHFTECSILSGHSMPTEFVDFNDYLVDHWPSTREGEERQTIETVQFYRTLFEHPKVKSITWWEFMDDQWLGAPSGFMTKDNRVKPVYEEIHKLIKGEWWSGTKAMVTDESGVINILGFLGEYEITCNGRKEKIVLGIENEETDTILYDEVLIS